MDIECKKSNTALFVFSLLTLSRVIVALGSANHTHVNFRDSKLTRLLQPSLSGNARMAIVCCATSSELYLEETRSTLAFASRAKMVKTRAQVNEVLDDRSIIRRLQLELAEARKNGASIDNNTRVQDLEKKAAKAGSVAREAKERLKLVFANILNKKSSLFTENESNQDKNVNKKKRRLSDSNLPLLTPDKSFPSDRLSQTSIRITKKLKDDIHVKLSPSKENKLLREAMGAKSKVLQSTLSKLDEMNRAIEEKEKEVSNARSSTKELEQKLNEVNAKTESIAKNNEELSIKMMTMEADYCSTLKKEAEKYTDLVSNVNSVTESNALLEKRLENLTAEKEITDRNYVNQQLEKENNDRLHRAEIKRLQEMLAEYTRKNDQQSAENNDLRLMFEQLQKSTEDERIRSAFELAESHSEIDKVTRQRQIDMQKFEKLQEKVKILSTTLHETEESKVRAEVERDQLSLELSTAYTKIDAVVAENMELLVKLENFKEQEKIQRSLLTAATVDLTNINAENAMLMSQLHESKGACEQLQNQVSEITTELHQSEKLFQSTLLDLKVKVDEHKVLLDKNNQIEQEANTFKTMIAELETTATSLRESVIVSENDRESLVQKLCFCEAERDSYKQQFGDKDVEYCKLQSRLKELEEVAERIRVESDNKDTLIDYIKIHREEVVISLKETEEKLQEAESLCGNHETQIVELQAEIKTLNKKNAEINQRLIAALELLETATNSIAEMEESIHFLQKSKEDLNSDIKEQERVIATSQLSIQALNTDLKEMREKRDELTALLSTSKAELEAVTLDSDRLRNKILDDSLALMAAQEMMHSIEEKTCHLESENARVSNEFLLYQEQSKQEINELLSSLSVLEQAKASLNDTVTDLRKGADDLQNELFRCLGERDQFEELYMEIDAEFNKIQQTNATLEKYLNECRIECSGKDVVQDSLLSKITYYEKQILEACKQLHQMQSNGLNCEIDATKNETGDVVDALVVLHESVNDASRRFDKIAEEVSILQAELKKTSSDRDDLVSRLLEESTLLASSNESLTSLEIKCHDLESRCNTTFQSNVILKDDLEKAIEKEAGLMERIELYQQEIGQAKMKIEALEDSVNAISTDRNHQVDEVTKLQQSYVALEKLHLQAKTDSTLLQESLRVKMSEMEIMTKSKSDLQLEYDECLVIAENLEHENKKLQQQVVELKQALASSERHFDEIDTLYAKKESDLEVKLTEIATLEAELCNMKERIKEIDSEREKLRDDVSTLQSLQKDASEELDFTRNSMNDAENSLRLSSEQLAEARKEIVDLSSQLEEMNAHLSKNKESAENVEKKMEEALGVAGSETIRLNTIIQDLECARSLLESQLKNTEMQVATIQVQNEAVTQELSIVKNALEVAEKKCIVLENHIDDFTNKQNQVDTENETTEKDECERTAIRGKVEELEKELLRTKNERDELITNLKEHERQSSKDEKELDGLLEQCRSKDEAIIVFQSTERSLKARLQATETKVAALIEEKEACERKLSSTLTKVKELSEALETIEETRTKESAVVTQKIESLQNELFTKENALVETFEKLDSERKAHLDHVVLCDDLRSQINELELAKKSADKRIEEMELTLNKMGNDHKKIDQLVEENSELRQLLASSNKFIDEARETRNQIQLDLIQKEELNRTLEHDISKLQEDLSNALSKAVLGSDFEQLRNEMREQMRQVLEEKKLTEAKLQSEIDTLKSAEMELKRLMGDEQREIITEAENAMQILRNECNGLQEALRKCESEFYTTRKLKEELEEENRRYFQQTAHLESKLSSIESDNNRLRRNANRQDSEKDSEIANLKRNVQKLKSERQSINEDMIDLEKQVQILTKEKQHLSQELTMIQDMALNVNEPSLEAENRRLLNEINDLKIKTENTIKERNERSAEFDQLQTQLIEMTTTLASKDKQILKLEKKRLTKDQVLAVKQLKADNALYKEQIQKYESEIENLRRRASARTDDAPEDIIISELRFDKEALEKKLRKFAAHCQRLEDDRLHIIQALRSTKPDDLDEDDLSKTVIWLCDKVTSLEEECDSLSKTSSIQFEVEKLRDHNSSLKRQVSDYQKRIEKLASSEIELQATVDSLRRDQQELRRASERLQGEAETAERETSKKVRYLEQENLQLMMEMKSTKKQLQNLKDELGMLKSHQPNRSAQKQTVIGNEKPPLARHSTPDMNHNKENNGYNTSTTRKRNHNNDLSSSSKKIALSVPRRSAGLGEALEPSDENTQECKQS